MSQFSYTSFEALLRDIRQTGHVISSFEKYDAKNPRTLIMRHDVDYTLGGVLDMALIEQDLGCSATYLFRVQADEYNLLAPRTMRLLEKLEGLGHEIGLHFEAMNVARALKRDPHQLIAMERAVLEGVLGHPISSCSEHRDFTNMVHSTPPFHEKYDFREAGFKNFAMAPAYTKEMKYLSDSNANWREGDPREHLAKHARLQVLIHPDWWFAEDLLLKEEYRHPRTHKDK